MTFFYAISVLCLVVLVMSVPTFFSVKHLYERGVWGWFIVISGSVLVWSMWHLVTNNN